jgi:hypothetical protein
MDTGVFNDDRYFDVFVEYAKASPEDVLVKITVSNRGSEAATIDVLPTLWFRNTWSWPGGGNKPTVRAIEVGDRSAIHASHSDPLFQESLEDYYLYCDEENELLFTENESNNARLFGTANVSPYVKDGINDYIVQGKRAAVNPDRLGTKASPHYHLNIPGGDSRIVRLRLTTTAAAQVAEVFSDFDRVFVARTNEADEFYDSILAPSVKADPDRARVVRQALAGMLWSEQYYYFDAYRWLDGHHAHPLHPARLQNRNRERFHMINDDVLSMPDKWEYPWYAAWDLAFHTIAPSLVDLEFAKNQLEIVLSGRYMHPNG